MLVKSTESKSNIHGTWIFRKMEYPEAEDSLIVVIEGCQEVVEGKVEVLAEKMGQKKTLT